MKKGYFFKDVEIFDGHTFFRGSVITEGPVIREIKPGAKPDREEDYIEVIGNLLVMPGMINMHTHVPMALFKGAGEDMPLEKWLSERIFPLEDATLSREMCRIAGLWGMAEMLLSGTTCFNDMYFFEEEIGLAGKEIGIKSVIGEGVICFPAKTGRSASDTLHHTAELAEKYRDDLYITVAVAPHSPYLTEEKHLVACGELSEKYGLPLHIHIAETRYEEQETIKKYGMREVEYLRTLGILSPRMIAAHCVWLNDAELGILKDKGVTVAHCPSSNMKLGSGVAPVTGMLHKGINVTIGTDGSASNNSLNLLKEAELAAKLQKGVHNDPTLMHTETCLKMVTSAAAKVLSGSFGLLAEGGRADMVVVDLDSVPTYPVYSPSATLLYASTPQMIREVFVEGRHVVSNGRVLTVDISSLRKEMAGLVRHVRKLI